MPIYQGARIHFQNRRVRCRNALCWVFGTLLLALAQATAAPQRSLPAYGADLAQTTVSGLSSGAYMAGQFAVAYSSIVTGAGLVAGGPYYCAGYPGRAPFIPYLSNALSVCMNPADAGVDPPDATVLWRRTQEFSRQGLIDDVANLKRQRIYLFSGRRDTTVTRAVVDQARNFYDFAGTAEVRYVDNLDAGHGMVTDRSADNACAVTAPPYFNNCGVRLAQEILAYLYPGSHASVVRPSGKLIRFDQSRFAARATGMSDSGYLYVPAACALQSCRVHVAFHGCRQGAGAIGDHFYAHAGYNEMADANRIMVLYPQVDPSPVFPYNPRGCWDFWGYASVDPLAPDFYTRNSPQARAVRAMLARLAQPRGTRPH